MLVGSVGEGVSWHVDAAGRLLLLLLLLLHPVRVPEMEAALKAPLVFWETREDV